jgi:DNA-binding protein HU-beta
VNKGQLTQAVNDIIQDGKTSELAVNAVIAVLHKTLARGEDIVITGFGSLKVVKREARQARNPSTGASVSVPAKRVVTFKMGSDLKAALSEA